MILTDANIWIDHFRMAGPVLTQLLSRRRILIHPFTIGELALGSLPDRAALLSSLALLPKPKIATDSEVLKLIERETLFATGLGYVDCHLLASTRLTDQTKLWTRDKRLHTHADRLGLAYQP